MNLNLPICCFLTLSLYLLWPFLKTWNMFLVPCTVSWDAFAYVSGELALLSGWGRHIIIAGLYSSQLERSWTSNFLSKKFSFYLDLPVRWTNTWTQPCSWKFLPLEEVGLLVEITVGLRSYVAGWRKLDCFKNKSGKNSNIDLCGYPVWEKCYLKYLYKRSTPVVDGPNQSSAGSSGISVWSCRNDPDLAKSEEREKKYLSLIFDLEGDWK